MNKNRQIKLQMFAAPKGLTTAADLQRKAREIDFVTSFGKNIQALLDVLSIARPIKKANGTALKTKKVTGTLADGNVAEGEEIPLSEFKVVEEYFDTINIEKYRKAVSIEAIAEKGYDTAVLDTDKEFKALLQNNVTNRLYTQLGNGSLVSHEATFQKAVAMAIGRVKDKFDKMGRTATGTAVWVNTLDLYAYLGEKDVTVQTVFGLQYIKNFLGADIVFVSSKVKEKTVYATPLNNILAYYVDPADAEFKKAGLDYTADSETGFIGFHTEGTYNRAISDMYAIMGLRIMCEYQDAIAHIAIGGGDTQKLKTLTVTSVAGTESGDSKITVAEQLQSPNNKFKVKTNAGSAATADYGADVKSWKNFESGDEITVTSGHHVTIVECDPQYKAVSKGDTTATVK